MKHRGLWAVLVASLVLNVALASVLGYFGHRRGWFERLAAITKGEAEAQTADAADWQWHDAAELTLEGRGFADTRHRYERLPAAAEDLVRREIWNLQQFSVGQVVRFTSDSTWLRARWRVGDPRLALANMPATAASGVDLYIRGDDGGWHWLGIGQPRGFPVNDAMLCNFPLDGKQHEFMLYLPLFNSTRTLHLGIEPGRTIEASPERQERPIVFYGSSIVQGRAVSRPGMAYPAILGRWLDRPMLNLGFSGEAIMEPEVAKLLGALDAAALVIDALPNMTPEIVRERAEPFIRLLREKQPDVPIVLVEERTRPSGAFATGAAEIVRARRAGLRDTYEKLTAAGVTGLHYVRGDELLGGDGEATVDDSHPTDLGMLRIAHHLRPVLEEVLVGGSGSDDTR